MRGVRWREEGWEGQCDECRQWWPLDLEAWRPIHGLRRCYACNREERRVYLARIRDANPEMRARHRQASIENQTAKRRLSPEMYLEYQRRWYADNHVRLNAERAEKYLIESEINGGQRRRSSRDETPETIAYRAAYRARWIAENGPPVPDKKPRLVESVEDRRKRKREWMRAKRAADRKAA